MEARDRPPGREPRDVLQVAIDFADGERVDERIPDHVRFAQVKGVSPGRTRPPTASLLREWPGAHQTMRSIRASSTRGAVLDCLPTRPSPPSAWMRVRHAKMPIASGSSWSSARPRGPTISRSTAMRATATTCCARPLSSISATIVPAAPRRRFRCPACFRSHVYIDSHPTGDIVVVLHQMGNHGPTCYKRYPPEFERFKPTCQNNDLSQCTQDEIVNAYDNALLYTDYFLTKTIELLKKNNGKFETALFWRSKPRSTVPNSTSSRALGGRKGGNASRPHVAAVRLRRLSARPDRQTIFTS